MHRVIAPCILENAKMTRALGEKLLLLFAVRQSLPGWVLMYVPDLAFNLFNSRCPICMGKRHPKFLAHCSQHYFKHTHEMKNAGRGSRQGQTITSFFYIEGCGRKFCSYIQTKQKVLSIVSNAALGEMHK